MAQNDPNLFDEIARWIPEEHLRDYSSFLGRVKHLDETDPVMRCILASGIFTVISRQVPAEVAKQLAEFQKTVGEQLAAAQANSNRLIKEMKNHTTHLQALHHSVLTHEHMNAVVEAGMEAMDKRAKVYLNILSPSEVSSISGRVRELNGCLEQVAKQAERVLNVCEQLEPTFNEGVRTMVQNAETLKSLTVKDVAASVKSVWRRWSWRLMLVTIFVTAAVIFLAWKMGAHNQAQLDKVIRQEAESARN